jgi:hypothetical protein
VERRNPYLILGIPFGTGRAEANKAFARRVKSLPADPAGADARKTDLTWALHAIDEGSATPEAELTYYRLPAATVGGTGVFAPPEEPGPVSDADADAALEFLRAAAAREALRQELSNRSGASS